MIWSPPKCKTAAQHTNTPTDLPGKIKITGVSNKVFTVYYVECAHNSWCHAPTVTNQIGKVRGLTPAVCRDDSRELHLVLESRTTVLYYLLNVQTLFWTIQTSRWVLVLERIQQVGIKLRQRTHVQIYRKQISSFPIFLKLGRILKKNKIIMTTFQCTLILTITI